MWLIGSAMLTNPATPLSIHIAELFAGGRVMVAQLLGCHMN